jgi:hypothetical protein
MYCHTQGWLIRRGLDWMIGFIDTLYTVLDDYRQYSAVAILHTFQFTVAHALGFPAFCNRILATDLSQSHWQFISHMKSSFHSLIHFLPFLLNHLPTVISGTLPNSRLQLTVKLDYFSMALYNPLARTPRKTACIIKDTCLLVRYIAMDALLLHSYASRECVYRVVA